MDEYGWPHRVRVDSLKTHTGNERFCGPDQKNCIGNKKKCFKETL